MIRKIILLSCLIYGGNLAAAAPASEASIREMLAVTEVRKLIDGFIPQMDGMMKNSMAQAMGGKALSPEQQKLADSSRAQMMTIMKEELSWESLEPMYISIYQRSLTQEEADGILAFYKSPAGVAMIKKMPVIMQNTMTAMQQKMGPMMQKIQAAAQETAKQVEAAQPKQG